jgi:hypothetical protein
VKLPAVLWPCGFGWDFVFVGLVPTGAGLAPLYGIRSPNKKHVWLVAPRLREYRPDLMDVN